MHIIGIDPGITGAVVILDTSTNLINFYDTPTISVKKARRRSRPKKDADGNVIEKGVMKDVFKEEYLPAAMAAILRPYTVPTYKANTHVIIEKVNAMPGQGVTSMFGFGKGFGIWIGILAALELTTTYVTPNAWKKTIMAGIQDKDAGRMRAMELFPSCTGHLTRKKDIGRADALLIVEYGRRTIAIQTKRTLFNGGNQA